MRIKQLTISCLLVLAAGLTPIIAQADVIEARLAQYRADGAGEFVASQGEALWVADNQGRSCTQCHADSPNMAGKHNKTGKRIEPMAFSVNPERFSNADKIEKWFLRNCKWTMGRVCTPQEKGNILLWLKTR